MATLAPARAGRLTFEQKMTFGMSAFIVLAFAQFALRGFVDYAGAPLVVHLHGMTMMAWLALLMTQATLAGRGKVGLHMTLGWSSVLLVPAILILGSVTCVTMLRLGRFPPFFTAAYFLALVHVGLIFFAALVATAVARRGRRDWHSRLMVGSTIVLLEPALGRVLPMPLIVPWGEWLAMIVQLGVAALMVRNDDRTVGHTHPATIAVLLTIVLSHVIVEGLALLPAWQDFATRVVAGG